LHKNIGGFDRLIEMPGYMMNSATVTSISSSAASRQAALTSLLSDIILFARVAPGRRLEKSELARLAFASPEQLDHVLPSLVSSGLVHEDETHIIVAPLPEGVMLAEVDRRQSLELFIAMVAARRATPEQCKRLMELQGMVRQAAYVGDVQGCIAADIALEDVIGEASGLLTAAEELRQLKVEYRRAWCALHTLSNEETAAQFRLQLVEAIVAHDPMAAKQAIDDFYVYLTANY
jgi:DNA-binding GntR family transcriptional regulator